MYAPTRIFTLDANIGAGKTTVLEYIHKHYRIPIDPEPVEKWMPYLKDLYTHDNGAFEFQLRVWLDRCWVQPSVSGAPILMERSPYFQRNVFVPVNVDNKRLSPRELELVNDMYDLCMRIWSPQGCIYLRSDPSRCKQRIKQRSRESEDNIPLEYLESLHKYHETAYMDGVSKGLPIIVIDVEHKTIPQIAEEVYNALRHLGMYSTLV